MGKYKIMKFMNRYAFIPWIILVIIGIIRLFIIRG